MASRNETRLILACPLTDFGASVFNHWPLHLTILHWFHLNSAKLEEYCHELNILANSTKAFSVGVGDDAMFGDDHDVRVRTLVANESLRHLHEQILVATYRNSGVPESPQWCGAGYRPHITYQENSTTLRADQMIYVSKFAIVSAVSELPFQRRVIDIFDLD